jgi:hypothetical protein
MLLEDVDSVEISLIAGTAYGHVDPRAVGAVNVAIVRDRSERPSHLGPSASISTMARAISVVRQEALSASLNLSASDISPRVAGTFFRK